MKRSKFSLSNYKLLTCDMGELVPVGMYEVLPGDTCQQATSLLVRVSPLLAPVMHPVHVRIHHWFVPYRLIWENWEPFITGGPDGMDDSEFPVVTPAAAGIGTLSDYLGVTPGIDSGMNISALPFRAYQLIWNEFYRDQDLQALAPISLADGLDVTTLKSLQHVNWEKDYFTSSRPWTQKGPEVTIPLGTTAPVVTSGDDIRLTANAAGATNQNMVLSNAGGPTSWLRIAGTTTVASEDTSIQFGNQTGLETDLSGASAVNINTFRMALALQRYEEMRARYGSRYVEYLRALGVRGSDARLQRPEYLGGGKQTIQFSEVLQTAVSDSADPDIGVGNLRGHGIGAVRSNRYRRFFEEHGVVLSLLSVKPRTMYAQGMPRHWWRRTKEDFWQRELQHIGQQEVYNREVMVTHSGPNDVFGYQDRYDEYRRTESTIAGEFRDTLDFWHYARIFASDVSLNSDFVKSVPTKRVNAVTSEDCLWIMANHSIQARRLVTGQATPITF